MVRPASPLPAALPPAVQPREITDATAEPRPRYSILTLVTDTAQYAAMLASFADAGFVEPDCEFLYVDNIDANRLDAYQSVNRALDVARGEYIILCHQDVRLEADRIERLDAIIDEISRRDPTWALLGNAGGVALGELAIRITDAAHGTDARKLDLPARVRSLDENFIVLRRRARLAASRDLSGFHFYGTDLCAVAEWLGYTAYVVDFHLTHLGGASGAGGDANLDDAERARRVEERRTSFATARAQFIDKYHRAMRARWVQTPCTQFYLSGSPWRSWLGNRRVTLSVARRLRRWLGS